jgi:diphosphomevalonate decarboxylase
VKKSDVVTLLLADRLQQLPRRTSGKAYAPSNIALCKYWGKRNQELNLPVTSSLSVSLADKGSTVELSAATGSQDVFVLNNKTLDPTSSFSKRLHDFLNLFRPEQDFMFNATIQTNIPIGAGLASSACGFASVVLALNDFFGWDLNESELSILARLGSGSASRSLHQGFVEWNAGVSADGMDSYAQALTETWPELCIGLLIVSDGAKPIGSCDAM